MRLLPRQPLRRTKRSVFVVATTSYFLASTSTQNYSKTPPLDFPSRFAAASTNNKQNQAHLTCGSRLPSAMLSNAEARGILKENVGHSQAIISLLKEVYGDWEDPSFHFPKPMPATEAGPSMVPYGKGLCQRRYLWTDAWGVLCFVGLAMRCNTSRNGGKYRRERLLVTAESLVGAVHATLGQPRGPAYTMLPGKGRQVGSELAEEKEGGEMAEMAQTPNEYVGLRIGKTRAMPGGKSDAGMAFDGMYFHYLDKWIFALLRFSQACEAFRGSGQGDKYLSQAETLIKTIHPYFVRRSQGSRRPPGGPSARPVRGGGGERGAPRGVYWKVGTDMSVISGLEDMGPSEDALSGWVVYSLVMQEGERRGEQGRGTRTGDPHTRGQRQAEAIQKGRGGRKELAEEAGGSQERSLSPIVAEQADMEVLAAAYMQGGRGLRVSSDGLGWGLLCWKAQMLGAWAEPVRTRLAVLAPEALEVSRGMLLPFRLYGALMGGRLVEGKDNVRMAAEKALDVVVPVELREKGNEHSCINKVMLAAALDPLAFARLESERRLAWPGPGVGERV